MLDTTKAVLVNQLHAALSTLNACIERCPDAAWDGPIANLTFCQVVFHALFFIKAIVHWKEKLARPARRETPAIPPGWINGILATASEIENSLLAPLAIPFGGSLLAIGERAK